MTCSRDPRCDQVLPRLGHLLGQSGSTAKAIGRLIQMLVLLSSERERDHRLSLVNAFYVTGEVDFVLYVTARVMKNYERVRTSKTSRRWS